MHVQSFQNSHPLKVKQHCRAPYFCINRLILSNRSSTIMMNIIHNANLSTADYFSIFGDVRTWPGFDPFIF